MAECGVCHKDIPPKELFKHRWTEHREEANAARLAGIKQRVNKSTEKPSPKNGSKPANPPARVATASIAEATSVFISPKTFSMCSVLLWQAREVAIKEWNWPADISPEDFLDTYLYETMKQRGIILGAYQVISHNGGNHGST